MLYKNCWKYYAIQSVTLFFSCLFSPAVVQKVNSLITNEEYGRLFAVVHFASRQWKVTNEDLILIENHVAAGCGDRIRMEKV